MAKWGKAKPLEWRIVLTILILVTAAFSWFAVNAMVGAQSARERLREVGVEATGTITSRRVEEREIRRERRGTGLHDRDRFEVTVRQEYYVDYRAATPDGVEIAGSCGSDRSLYDAATIGDPIEILFNPADPSHNDCASRLVVDNDAPGWLFWILRFIWVVPLVVFVVIERSYQKAQRDQRWV